MYSVTGGSADLVVVLGWATVIKYVPQQSIIMTNKTNSRRSLFYIPGTLTGSFIVDSLGPKNTLVSSCMQFIFDTL